MPQRIVEIPGIGEVLLVKRRGSKNLRLSLLPDGRIRVGMPAWVPYSAGVKFAINRSDWIAQHRPKTLTPPLKDGDLIGKSHRLSLIYAPGTKKVSTRLGKNLIQVNSHLPTSHSSVQKKALLACERALKKEAASLLTLRLNQIAGRHSISYKHLKIKKLSSRWGSCSNDKTITLSSYLIQLPWHLIDYVIMHELIHTVHLNHGSDFWQTFEAYMPSARKLRKEVNRYRPAILPNGHYVT